MAFLADANVGVNSMNFAQIVQTLLCSMLVLASPCASAAAFINVVEGAFDEATYCPQYNECNDVSGAFFRIVYTGDDTFGWDEGYEPHWNIRYGETRYGVKPPVSAVITIEGVGTFSISGSSSAHIEQFDFDVGDGIDHLYRRVNDYDDSTIGNRRNYLEQIIRTQIQDESGGMLNNTDFGGSVGGDLDTYVIDTYFRHVDYVFNSDGREYEQFRSFNGRAYSLTHASGQFVSPPLVPEPATWAMLLMGMFGIGLAMRSRRRVERQLLASFTVSIAT